MFNSLTGIVAECHENLLYLLTNESTEWIIHATKHTTSSLKPGEKQRVLIYTQFKEDDVTLFGFETERERSLFKNLIKVNGIGPKAAIKAMSGCSIAEFLLALENADIASIANIPGIGKKTAEKIIFTLKGKIEADTNDPRMTKTLEIIESLVSMGFDRRLAQNAIRDIQSTLSTVEERENEGLLIQQAIVKLSMNKKN